MYFDDLSIGMTVEIAPTVIEKEKMLAFARTYDNLPLHTDEEYAKETPFDKLERRNPRNGLVEVSIDVYNQHGQLVLKDVTEAIVKCRK